MILRSHRPIHRQSAEVVVLAKTTLISRTLQALGAFSAATLAAKMDLRPGTIAAMIDGKFLVFVASHFDNNFVKSIAIEVQLVHKRTSPESLP